jgi:hypothetical protein
LILKRHLPFAGASAVGIRSYSAGRDPIFSGSGTSYCNVRELSRGSRLDISKPR